MSCATVQQFPSAGIISGNGCGSIIGDKVIQSEMQIPGAEVQNGVNRRRRISSSALYEVHRKDLNDVCYLFVPDEYVSW